METEITTTNSIGAPATAARGPGGRGILARPEFWAWVVVGLMILFSASVRFRLRSAAFERDEGEYAYAGQLILQGIPPYQLAYNMKFPGTYLAYAAIMAVFGQTVSGVHLGFILVNACGIIVVYLLTARLAGRGAGVLAAAIYMYGSLISGFLGTSAHATQFVVPAAVGGLFVLLRSLDRPGLAGFFASGLLLGVATLMKQHALIFVVFGGAFVAWRMAGQSGGRQAGRAVLGYAAGVAVPLLLTAAWLWHAGVFGKFWFWTIDYARQYASEFKGLGELGRALRGNTPGFFVVTLVLAVPGLFILWRRSERWLAVFMTGWLACALVAIIPSFNFWQHYFILPLPATALLTAVTVVGVADWWRRRGSEAGRRMTFTVFGLALAGGIVAERGVFFQASPEELPRLVYGWQHPFVESEPVAAYLKSHTTLSQTIAILGSEPQIYFYAQRHSATGYIYTYGLMERQDFAKRMQQEMIGELEKNRPAFIVWVRMQASWMARDYSDATIFQWAQQYLNAHYEVAGAVEVSAEPSQYYWDGAAAAHAANARILVFRRAGPD